MGAGREPEHESRPPGGAYGVLGHQVRDHKIQEASYDPDGRSSGGVAARIREGHTFVATLAPETRATLVAATAYAAQLGCDGHGVALEPLENDRNWRRDLHPSGDRALFDAIWNGPAAERLRSAYPWGGPGSLGRHPAPGGKFDVRAGIVSVWAPGYIEDSAQLDSLVDLALAFAAELRVLCAPHAAAAAFADPLPPPPGWTGRGKAYDSLMKSLDKAPMKRARRGLAPRDDVLGAGQREDERWAGLRDFAAGYAAKRGLDLEDGDAFGHAFPDLPYTGWAQFAARGSLHNGKAYRVAMTAQRPFLWQASFASGGAVAVAPAGARHPGRACSSRCLVGVPPRCHRGHAKCRHLRVNPRSRIQADGSRHRGARARARLNGASCLSTASGGRPSVEALLQLDGVRSGLLDAVD